MSASLSMHVGDFIGRGATYFPDRLAVVDVARGAAGRFTYKDLDARATALARWLRDRAGVRRGDRVGLLCHNGVEYLDALFACGKLGATLVPFNWRLHERELAELCEHAAPRVLLYGPEFIAQARALRGPLLVHLAGDGAPDRQSTALDRILAAPGGGAIATPDLDEEDIACLLFTGGTTGASKGAQISYRMIAWNALTTAIHELDRGDVTITHTPMFHTGGLLVYTLPLLIFGGTVVIMRRWDPEEMLRLIGAERVTMFFCVPTQYQQMISSPRFHEADFGSVRFMTSGGAPLPVPLIAAFHRVHKVPFKQGFGMTEFGPGIFSMGPEHAEQKAGSIGRPNYFVSARLADERNQDVPVGAAGELLLKGPACFSGYFADRATSPRAAPPHGLRPCGPSGPRDAVDEDGWFHTGDVARVDEDGFYYIVDRKKDMFISGGENVYPVEIERALYEHPSVGLCAVIGVPDDTWGQVGRAYVVPAPGTDPTEADLLAFLRDRLARYKLPRSIAFTQTLPLSPAGKILKREIRSHLGELP